MSEQNLLTAERVHKAFGLKTLLDEVSLGIHAGDRIGVVGLNGGGKSTLLAVLTGVEEPDSGRVARVGGLRMASVRQDGQLEGETVGETILAPLGLAEYEWASSPKVRDVLEGLGITALGLDRPLEALSGGQRRRVALAAALVQDVDLLLLDEPTNHLDVEGANWLANHLVARRSALVAVTHDRWFLDTVATTTWEVVGGNVNTYQGGYNDWVFARAERDRQADASEDRRRNLARKELAWLRRGPPARTSKPRYRIEAAEALIADVPAPRDSLALTAFALKRLGRVAIELEDVTIAPPGAESAPLLRDLTFRIPPGGRIGLVGVNGSGKTTLLRTIGGELQPLAGKRIQGQTVKIGWLKQELDDLPGELTVLAAVEEIAGRITVGDKDMSAAQLAERLGFAPARQRSRVRELSGGERRRLQLTRILMAEPNVLLLDEPTNDLDIDTLQQLEDLLDGFGGTLVVISHDRFLIERICDSVYALFGDGKLTNLPGGIDEYLRRRHEMDDPAPPPLRYGSDSEQGEGESASSTAAASPGGVSGTAPGKVFSNAEMRQGQKEMQRLERQLVKLDQTVTEINAKMAAASADASSLDTEALSKLAADSAAAAEQRDAIEIEWMELAEKFG